MPVGIRPSRLCASLRAPPTRSQNAGVTPDGDAVTHRGYKHAGRVPAGARPVCVSLSDVHSARFSLTTSAKREATPSA